MDMEWMRVAYLEGRGALYPIGRSKSYLIHAPHILQVGQINVVSQLRGSLVEFSADKATLKKQNKRETMLVIQAR